MTPAGAMRRTASHAVENASEGLGAPRAGGMRRDPTAHRIDPNRPCYFISIAAELARVHPRTLRIYEEEGLLSPKRRNNLRLYSEADIQRVRLIRFLTRRQGVNLAGVKVILQLEAAGKIRVYDLFNADGVDSSDDEESSEGT